MGQSKEGLEGMRLTLLVIRTGQRKRGSQRCKAEWSRYDDSSRPSEHGESTETEEKRRKQKKNCNPLSLSGEVINDRSQEVRANTSDGRQMNIAPWKKKI